MKKNIVFDISARNGLKRGVDALADAVKVTLGPMGRNVIMSAPYIGIKVTKDGVSVAKEIDLEDPLENMGAQMVKEVASKTADLAGDGTTTATVLSQAMITEGLKNITAGANPMDIKRGMDKAVEIFVKQLESIRIVIGDDLDKIGQIATISANNDYELGELIKEAYEKVGIEGTIRIEDSSSHETYVDVIKGMQFDRGYLSPYFITDTDSKQVLFENPKILIYDGKINTVSSIEPLLNYASTLNSLLLICDDMSSDVLARIVVAKLKGCKIAVIKSPFYGLKKKENLEDIAVLTGSYVINEVSGYNLGNFTSEMLGTVEKCVITSKQTMLLNGGGKESKISNHVNLLKEKVNDLPTRMEQDRMNERISRITNGVAILNIGDHSTVAMKEKKDRVDDALRATKAAIEEGIVAGGGVALLKISESEISGLKNDDEITGAMIIKKACSAPILQIANNCGISGEVIISKILENTNPLFGYDFKNGEYVDMFESGIIDPKKVTRVALENANSVAGMIITTECALVNINQETGLPEFLK